MKYLYHYAICLCIILASCGSQEQEGEEGKTSAAGDSTAMHTEGSDAQQAEKAPPFDFSANFYQGYEGTIGNIPVHANIVKAGDALRGSYYYEKHGQPIEFHEGKFTKEGYFKAKEHDREYNETGSFMGRFVGNRIEGVWQSPDKSKQLKVDLKAIEAPASVHMPCVVYHDEQVMFYTQGDTATPNYTTIYTALFPNDSNQSPAADKLYKQIEGFFGELAVPGQPWASMEAMRKSGYADYKESIEPFVEEADMDYANNWSHTTQMSVVYNDKGLFTVAWEFYSFSGGAHGNYGCSYYCYDLSTGKRLKLANVFKGDYQQVIAQALMKSVRAQFEIPDKETLADHGFFDDEILPTENFYLTDKGIGFYYSPYEIGPYAMGAVNVFVPFKECQGLVRTDGPLKALFQ